MPRAKIDPVKPPWRSLVNGHPYTGTGYGPWSEWPAADKRSWNVLCRVLTAAQFEGAERTGHITLPSHQRDGVIALGVITGTVVWHGSTRSHGVCVHASGRLPRLDSLAALVLYITAHEEHFWAKANVS